MKYILIFIIALLAISAVSAETYSNWTSTSYTLPSAPDPPHVGGFGTYKGTFVVFDNLTGDSTVKGISIWYAPFSSPFNDSLSNRVGVTGYTWNNGWVINASFYWGGEWVWNVGDNTSFINGLNYDSQKVDFPIAIPFSKIYTGRNELLMAWSRNSWSQNFYFNGSSWVAGGNASCGISSSFNLRRFTILDNFSTNISVVLTAGGVVDGAWVRTPQDGCWVSSSLYSQGVWNYSIPYDQASIQLIKRGSTVNLLAFEKSNGNRVKYQYAWNGTHWIYDRWVGELNYNPQAFSSALLPGNYTIMDGFFSQYQTPTVRVSSRMFYVDRVVMDSSVTPIVGGQVNVSFNVIASGDLQNYSISIISPSLVETVPSCYYVTLSNVSCSFIMQYYDEPGSYDINIFLTDGILNDSVTRSFTYGEVQSFSKEGSSIEFTGELSGNKTSNGGIYLVNNGNAAIINVSVTAYNLIGSTVPTNVLNASYFRAGPTYANSVQLQHGVPVYIPYTINPGNSSQALFNLWLNAPTNVYPQLYVSSTAWSIDVIYE